MPSSSKPDPKLARKPAAEGFDPSAWNKTASKHKVTQEQLVLFLEALTQSPNVAEACRRAGIKSYYQVQQMRRDNPDFRKAWEASINAGYDMLEAEAVRRAHEGTPEPVFYQGIQCGTVIRFSDQLMIRMLEAHRPDRYTPRQKQEQTGANGGPPVTLQVTTTDPVEAAAVYAKLIKGS